jgi:hypothetical protein
MIPKIVDHPNSPELAAYHALLKNSFSGGEVECLERLQQELAGNGKPGTAAHYLCLLLCEPEAGDRIASGAYASVQGGILALRFLVTDQAYRGTGASQETIRLLLAEAQRWSVDRRQVLWACFGECVDASEAFFNRALGMRRLYVPEPGNASLREIHYELPHLGNWGSDGEPLDPESGPVREHLQIAAGKAAQIPFAVLENILTSVWRAWYVHSEQEFDSRSAWERHYQRNFEGTLRGKILEPLRHQRKLLLLTRAERERRRQAGWNITDLDVK